jgi:cation diffusion facilitator CzcD-associated flavoprotein CzcO
MVVAADSTTQTPSHKAIPSNRSEPGSVNIPLGKFPSAESLSGDPVDVAHQIIEAFNNALARKDYKSISDLFLENGYWRDHLVNSWDLRTLKGKDAIQGFLETRCTLKKLCIDRSTAYRSPRVTPLDGVGDPEGIQFYTLFESEVGTGRGIVRVARTNGTWKILTFFLTLEEIKGYEEPLGGKRSQGVEHGWRQDRKNWQDVRNEEAQLLGQDPTVLIIGAGQAGLTSAARLKMLKVNALVIDTNDRIGDNWRKRYHQLVLHDPVWYDHMPYLNFPSHWPIFTPKDKLAEFFETYAKILELNVWMKTNMTLSSWDESKRQWTIDLERRMPDGSIEKRTVHPRHVIQATGHSGKKNFPQINGMDSFKGDRLCHSSEFAGAKENSKGKKAVIVGSCNSGHDIAQDFYEKGYDVTMVQRSSTCVVSSNSITDVANAGLYDESGPPVEDADIWLMGMPSELLKTQQILISEKEAENDAAILDGLEKAGFKLDRGPDASGLFIKYFQRGGGYYIDVGASQLIIDGKIKIKQGQEITEILPHGLRFADGSELEADEIIFATGYQNMRTQARIIFGDELADRVKNVWGFDEEGEFRTMWRRSGHPGFWFMGGNLALCRYFSRILALQIKAIETGLAEA